MIVKQPGTRIMSIVVLMVVCISLVGCTFGSEVENMEPSGQAEREWNSSVSETSMSKVPMSEATVLESSVQDDEAMQEALEEVQDKLKLEQAEIERNIVILQEARKKEAASIQEQEALKVALEAEQAAQEEVEKQIMELQDAKKKEAAVRKE